MALTNIFFFLTCACAGEPELSDNVGLLAPCKAPNCVSSKETEAGRRLPPLVVIGKPAAALSAIYVLLSERKDTRIVKQSANYIHAEVHSAVFGFVDDVEFLIDRNSRLQFRSAARRGHWDFGVNRRRMVRLRNELLSRYRSVFKGTE